MNDLLGFYTSRQQHMVDGGVRQFASAVWATPIELLDEEAWLQSAAIGYFLCTAVVSSVRSCYTTVQEQLPEMQGVLHKTRM